ncbi:CheR family methyltransferase [Chryseosolibacter indicus]|uniref:Protein-glutamate O-methyltransferase CheR n=1 Tax=Chryseosolibacter indicus TaxID=2782351 RepID=A0ABS5VTM9_9BACT|nr:protein-glutamate O-methyltransferase CheR [Chryseosolibacter indicus]MBT1704775.1 protein-glutamate O-methyltransferase CheR [Chryseosolibacter indicus]
MDATRNIQLSDEEVEFVLNDVMDLYGYDFTNYSKASLKRRINRLISNDRFPSFAEFRYRIINDKDYFSRFVEEITVNVTEMFRDVTFYKTLRQQVIPVLATWPLIRIWHAGCSTGEEVYSMAILLHEANLLHKSLLYATDINPAVLQKVREGVFPLSQMRQYSENYILSGGNRDFSSYYTAQYNAAKFDEQFGKRIVLATHNLVSDGSFNEFQLIMCRNVMIYFDKQLQDKVLHLFYDSLEQLGFLALGSKETLRFTDIHKNFKQIENKEKIWRKIK